MAIEIDNPLHFDDFIRLNEQWISEHFTIEEADRKLAENPAKVLVDGGHILSLVIEDRVVGVCALFKEDERRYELARMAVDPVARGAGHGNTLIQAALGLAGDLGATTVFLLTNTALEPACALYRKHGFQVVSQGPHPVYARCNLVMEYSLRARR